MTKSTIDRGFDRRLSALINSGQPQILQGGRKGLEKFHKSRDCCMNRG